MSVSIPEQIIVAAVAALTTPGGGLTLPTGLTVHRFRALPLGQDKLPAVVVFPLRDTQIARIGTESAPVSDRRLEFRCECRVVVAANAGGQSCDAALEPLMLYVIRALNVDPTFGGLVSGLQNIDVTWAQGASMDKLYGGVAVDFLAHYGALAADPSNAFIYPD